MNKSKIKLFTPVFSAILIAIGFFVTQISFAANFGTGASITNTPPSFTSGPSDGGSSTSTPTNAGANVTFTATATDDNNDQYYLAVCKTNSITVGTDAAPTCASSQTWAISTVTNSGSQASVTYATSSGDAESNAWYAFVCDKKATGPACSSASQGSGNTGSPFNVNHKPSYTFTSATDTSGGTIAPGDTVRVTVSISDADTDGGQDTDQMYVCASGDTFTGSACSATEYCHTALAAPGSVYCDLPSSLTTVPTAHGSYGFEVFVVDMHGMVGTDTSSHTYSVIDVAPYLDATFGTGPDGYTIDTPPSLGAGSSVTDHAYVGISDDNGDLDVTDVEMVLFDSNTTTNTCSASENNCYIVSGGSCTYSNRSTAGSGKTATGTDNSFDADCTFTIWFNANYSSGWKVQARPTDGLGKNTAFSNSPDTVSTSALSAINVAESSIAYGALSVGSASAGQSITIQNLGNQIIDIILYSSSGMCTDYPGCSGDVIPSGQQKWAQALGVNFDWDTQGHVLLTSGSDGDPDTNGCANIDLAVRTSHASGASDENIYWKLKIPAAQPTGTYSGANDINYTSSGSCTGTP